MNTFRIILLLIAIVIPFKHAFSQTWKTVGTGQMQWAFFKIYTISLQTFDGIYKPGVFPQALEITYHRDIPSKRLVNATRDQLKHIAYTHPDLENWMQQLSDFWPDINKGERLRFEVDQEQNNVFFHNGQTIGSVANAEFSYAFLSIWLSPKTSEPDLRQELINSP